jgi:hypothetical protein
MKEPGGNAGLFSFQPGSSGSGSDGQPIEGHEGIIEALGCGVEDAQTRVVFEGRALERTRFLEGIDRWRRRIASSIWPLSFAGRRSSAGTLSGFSRPQFAGASGSSSANSAVRA